jgi:hypothetical protein
VHDVARIALYGLAAAASPTALLATLAILSSGRGRLNGTVFMVAFVLAQSVSFLVVYAVGSTVGHHQNNAVATYLELAAGVALIALALLRRKRRGPRVSQGSPRTEALLARLRRVRPGPSLGVGLVLGVGAKRLALTIVAAGTIAVFGLPGAEQAGLGLLYVGLATLVVWIPVVFYVIFGRRSDDVVAAAETWIRANEGRLTLITAFVLGVLLVVDATVRLLA